MSDCTVLHDVAEKHQPKPTYRKDYEPLSYSVDQIDLEIELNEDYTLVTSHMQIRRHADHRKVKALKLDGEALMLESIKINHEVLSPDQYQVTDNELTIHAVPDDCFPLEIVTRIFPQNNTALSGLYRVRETYCTQCEAEGFRRITYFFDRPDVLTLYTTKITADRKRFPILLSNGNLIDSGDLEDGRHWVKWQDPYKKPSYLFAMVAGDFDVLQDQFTTASNKNVSLRLYVDKGYRDQTLHAMESLKMAMRWDEETYGREYDLDIYMIVAMGDFNMGAMENKGLNIFNTKYILARPDTATDEDYIHILSVIGHEYFHNWTGNRITCRDWFQLSLKEGLTIFRDQSFSEDTLSHAVMRIRNVRYLRDAQFPEDAGPLAHPVRPDSYIEINNFYTTTIYEKGSEVIRMLRTILGKPLFRKGMDLYFSKFDGQAVTIEDFVATFEAVSSLDLTQFRLWYSQAGTPQVTGEGQYDEAHQRYQLTLHQKTNPTPGQKTKKPLHIPIRMGLLDQNGKDILLTQGENSGTELVLSLTEATQTFTFENIPNAPVPSLLRDFSAPVKLKYAYSEEELIFLLKHDQDPFNRWEAGQHYLMDVLLRMVQDIQNRKTLQLPYAVCEAFEYILKRDEQDKLFVVEMLSLPTMRYMAEQMEVVDVDAIHASREFALTCIAKSLEKTFLEIYHRYLSSSNKVIFNIDEMGKRQLKNHALSYLMLLPAHAELGMRQFQQSLQSNMTDTQAALYVLSNLESPFRAEGLEQFYRVAKHDALMVDKWFAIQASSKLPGTLQSVKDLMQHPAFNIKNPNNVYALIGTFSRNMVRFHVASGEGYVWLRECIQQLDVLNPQVAARMLQPLTAFRRYDKERQVLMKKQLEILLDQKPSNDVYELVAKSLK